MPKHKDFQKIYNNMLKQYGKRGKQVYYAWVNKHGYDDTKPLHHTKYPENMKHNPHSIVQNILKPKKKKFTTRYTKFGRNWFVHY